MNYKQRLTNIVGEKAAAYIHRRFQPEALQELTKRELMQIKGMSERRADRLLAAATLVTTQKEPRAQISNSNDAYTHFQDIGYKNHEEFHILVLNRANKCLGTEKISQGGVSGTVVDAKIVFRKALTYPRAANLILCHNHPSGNLKPSQSDIRLTHRMVKAGKLLDLPVIDHLIVTADGYTSIAEQGKLNPTK